jgi:hypothetical protein
MESTVRAPQTGDVVFVFAKMNSGKLTEISGNIEEISMNYVYFTVDCIELIHSTADDDGQPLEKRIWPDNAVKFLRVGVPLNKMKPFEGTWDENAPCWEVRI